MLDRLLDDVRARRSRALVLRGEAGVGKTALLEYVAAHSEGCRVLRVAGVESEMELPYAGVHQLCVPMLDSLDTLPAPQRDAVRTAFGLASGDVADRFLVGLAVLSLLAAAAEERPLVCLVDDAHWLDLVSAQLLGFVARRLLAESMALVFAVRDRGAPALDRLPERTIGGLRQDDARALLAEVSPGRMDERIRDRFVSETRGNPLALVELPRGLTAAELAGGFALPPTRPLDGEIELSFLRRVKALPAPTRLLLAIAAADPLGDTALLRQAAKSAGIDSDAEVPAEEAGLLEVGTHVRFRHPLVRSAAYRAASIADRRAAHLALAAATDPHADPDRRAWHLGQAAADPDEDIAADLERSAERAQARGGIAAAAAFLERAVALTADPGRRVRRALAAARAKIEAVAPEAADRLITVAETGPLDELQRATAAQLRAQLAFVRRRGSDAPALLLAAAEGFERLDHRQSRQAYLQALGAAIFAGRLGRAPNEHHLAQAARAAPPAPTPPKGMDLLLDGITTRYTVGYRASVPALARALEAFRDEAARGEADVFRWLWLACPVAPEPVAPELWDYENWLALANQAVRLAREAGALGVLPIALSYRAGVHVHAGEFAAAAALIEEADAITAATGDPPLRYTSLALVAWRGDEPRASRMIATATAEATARGEGRAIGLIGYATAVLHNGLGRYRDALAGAQLGCEHDDLGFYGWTLVEMIEAAARSDALVTATSALSQLEERADASGTEWAQGLLARSKALVSSGIAAEKHHREAIDHLAATPIAVHLARAQLLYGEWLRRENRRVDAREQLRAAFDSLQRIGADGFANRARHELAATGATARERTFGTRSELTPQEAHIARLAAEGRTNPEIAGALFISARTVEYHLAKVFTKLGISTRRELRRALRDRT